MQGVRAAEKLPGLLACIHSNNVMLRWLLLHMAGHPHSKLSAAVAKQSIDKGAVIRLLLDSAYLESWVSRVPICWHTHSLSTEMSSAGVQMMQALTSCLYVTPFEQPPCFRQFTTQTLCYHDRVTQKMGREIERNLYARMLHVSMPQFRTLCSVGWLTACRHSLLHGNIAVAGIPCIC